LFSGVASFNGFLVGISGAAQVNLAANSVRCSMPLDYFPGSSFGISYTVSPNSSVIVYAVEDQLPMGWSANLFDNGGLFDPVSRKIKWGPFFDSNPRILTCHLVPPAKDAGALILQGVGVFGDVSVPITGQRETSVAPFSQANGVIRALPAFVRTGGSLSVTNSVRIASNIVVYAVEDHVPNTCTATDINEGGFWDSSNHKIKWGPFFDSVPRQLSYRLLVAPNAAGPVVFDGICSFDGVEMSIQGNSSLSLITNQIPVARDDTVAREYGQSLTINASALLNNDSDADGDSLILISVAPVSDSGALLIFTNGFVTYQPSPTFNSDDQFRYSLSDGFGGMSTATVTVTVQVSSQSLNIISIEKLLAVTRLSCRGIPHQNYLIQASESLTLPTWINLGRVTASATGLFQWEDFDATYHPVRFYRAVTE
jgi:hypothetical protein